MSKAAVRAIRLFEHISSTGIRGRITAGVFTSLLKLIHPRKSVMLSNMKIAYPKSSEQWRREMCGKCYEHLGWTIAEILALQHNPSQVFQWVKAVHNDGLVRELLAKKHGVLFLSAHLGNWEILSSWYAQYAKQHGHELHVVYQEIHDEDISQYVKETRERSSAILLPKDISVQKYAHMLKAGMHIALLGDIAGTGRMMVPFMGADATNMPGPAVMALLSGVSVIPVYSYRVAPFEHEVVFLDPVKLPDARAHDDRLRLTVQAFNDVLEQMIRDKPEQWFWLHKRWRP